MNLFPDFDELFRDFAEVRDAVKKELARNSKIDDVIGDDEEELVVEDYQSDDDENVEKKFGKPGDDDEEEMDYSLRV